MALFVARNKNKPGANAIAEIPVFILFFRISAVTSEKENRY